ncbi:MAG: polyphosphate:AMP phosphotransferase [Planctomycetota bacterium]
MTPRGNLLTAHDSPWHRLEGTRIFEAAELGLAVPRAEFREQEPILRKRLLDAQARLREAGFPVLVLFGGVDGAGKGETANVLSEWMDPRRIVTRSFGTPSEEEGERPEHWRFWRDLPPRGYLGVFLSAWYSRPLLDRAYENIDAAEFDARLDKIVALEKMLADDGALIVKFWMHLGREQQRRRLQSLEEDPLLSWRVTKLDWKHWRLYDRFIGAAEQLLRRTDAPHAHWTIIEGADPYYRNLTAGRGLLDALEQRLAEREAAAAEAAGQAAEPPPAETITVAEAPAPAPAGGVLAGLDLTKELDEEEYRSRLKKWQARLNLLHRQARDQKRSMILVFEGWDAAGKGGAIRRVTAALDARDFEVISIAAPTDEERAHHYLWRFWRHLPRAGRVIAFDRSWYGRVLVERIEGFAKPAEWERAYDEINEFERLLVDHGTVLAKFWLHITPEEQERRFLARKEIPYKRWKLTAEDWRNRARWTDYERAVEEMMTRTGTEIAPWHAVPANDKGFARIAVLKHVCRELERALERRMNGG